MRAVSQTPARASSNATPHTSTGRPPPRVRSKETRLPRAKRSRVHEAHSSLVFLAPRPIFAGACRFEPQLSPLGASNRASSVLELLPHVEAKTLLDRLPAILYVADIGVDGRWHYVSRGVESILGFSQAEWIEDPGSWRARCIRTIASACSVARLSSMTRQRRMNGVSQRAADRRLEGGPVLR